MTKRPYEALFAVFMHAAVCLDAYDDHVVKTFVSNQTVKSETSDVHQHEEDHALSLSLSIC